MQRISYFHQKSAIQKFVTSDCQRPKDRNQYKTPTYVEVRKRPLRGHM